MFRYPFFNPLFGCSRGKSPPPTIIPKRDEYLLSRRNLAHFSQYHPFLLNFGITKTSGYDPPWCFKTYSDKGKERSAEKHYPTMSKADIQNLPVREIAADNSVLLLWVTAPCLLEGIELIPKWGFMYKTAAFTWIKQNRKSDGIFTGMGYYTRANAEYCLLATRGRILERKSHSVSSVVLSHIERHSKKPDEVRDGIVKLFGDLPKIELFAREQAKGWDSWGNEV